MELTYHLGELDYVATQLIANLNSKTILLYGEIGAGKTTLVKSIAKALGASDEVNSPSFSIVNEYALNDDIMYHFDLFRVHSIDEAYNFGIEDYLFSNNWVVIEWPELIKPILYSRYSEVFITEKNKELRHLILKNN